jgi:hypothetical protein
VSVDMEARLNTTFAHLLQSGVGAFVPRSSSR